MPLWDDITEYINKKALGRKGKVHALSKTIFERGIHHELMNDIDHAENIFIDEFIPIIAENDHLHHSTIENINAFLKPLS